MIDPINLLAELKYIDRDYTMWWKAAEIVVRVVESWPEFIEPPRPGIRAFAERKFGWRQFLPRWLEGKALDDVDQWLDVSVGLGAVIVTLTMVELMKKTSNTPD